MARRNIQALACRRVDRVSCFLAKADEGAEQVDGVGGRNLGRQRMCERRLAAGVDEEVGGGERNERCDDVAVVAEQPSDRLNRAQLFGWDGDGIGVGANVESAFRRTAAQ